MLPYFIIKSKNDPKYHQDNDNDLGFYQIQLLYINFFMKYNKIFFKKCLYYKWILSSLYNNKKK
jgi:hypothetical protein